MPGSCYDHPQYWDLAFRDETQLEADFLEAAAKKYQDRPVHRIVEPGCGGGRLVVEMASRGYEVTGFDLSQPAIRYLTRRLKRRGLEATLQVTAAAVEELQAVEVGQAAGDGEHRGEAGAPPIGARSVQ